MSSRFADALGLPKRSADPAVGEEALAYYNTTLKAIRFHDGANWQTVGTGAGGGSAADAPIIKTVSNASEVIFNTLDLNTDEMYEVQYSIYVTGDTNFGCQFNGETGNKYFHQYGYFAGSAASAGQAGAAVSQAFVGYANSGGAVSVTGRFQIGKIFRTQGGAQIDGVSSSWNGNTLKVGGLFFPTVDGTNITSMRLFPTGAGVTFSGTIVLRKVKAPTTVVGGGAPKVIDVSAQSSVTISSLDGDADGFWELILSGTLASGAIFPVVRPNNDTTAANYLNTGERTYYDGSTPGAPAFTQPGRAGMMLAQPADTGAGTFAAKMVIDARTGKNRIAIAEGASFVNGWAAQSATSSIWKNTANNITSLVVDFNGVNFTGKIVLRKLLDPAVVGAGPSVVQTLPTTGNYEGREVYLQPDAANQPGVKWRMRYDALAGKWDFAGGPDLLNQTGTTNTITSTGGAALPNSPVSVVVPVAGEYEIFVSGSGDAPSPIGSGQMFLYPAGAGFAGSGAVQWRSDNWNTGQRTIRSSLTAGTLALNAYTVNGSGRIFSCSLGIRPIRIG